MIKKIIYTTALTVLTAISANAQQLPLFSQYYYNPFLYNPGFTGTGDQANAYLIHRSQWKDMPGAPVTYALTVDGPVKEKQIGLGLSLFNDQVDIFNRTGLYSSYSYRFAINSDHEITAGLSLGVIDNKIDYSRAIVNDVNDPLIYTDNRRKVTMDANFGVGYFWKDLKVGFSIPQLLGNKIKYLEEDKNIYTLLKRHYILSGQYSIVISDKNDITALPSIMMRYAKGTPFQFDINANFDWKDMVRAGISYRFGYAVGFNIGTRLNKNLTAGYTYEWVTSPIGGVAGGGHEIMLGYSFGKKSDQEAKIRELNDQMEASQIQNDSLLRTLKNKDAEHTEEIEKLKKQLNEVDSLSKLNRAEIKITGNDTSDVHGTGDIRKENVSNYIGEDGQPIPSGYYVIMGAFKIKENAENLKKLLSGKGNYVPQIIYNPNREFYYLNVFFTNDEQTAKDVMEVAKKDEALAWVFSMQ